MNLLPGETVLIEGPGNLRITSFRVVQGAYPGQYKACYLDDVQMLEFEKSSKKSRLVWCLVLLFTAFMMFGGADDPTNLWANRVRMASAPIAFAGVVMLFAFLVSIHRHIHFRTPSGEIAVYTGYAGAELITKTCQTFEQAKHARMSRIRDELEA